jgi:phytoene desaturase
LLPLLWCDGRTARPPLAEGTLIKQITFTGAPRRNLGSRRSALPTEVPGPDAPHAIVIGTGLGGLASAIRLSCRGYRVTMLEKLDAPGGRAYVWRQDGFTFDAGPTVITAPVFFEELWQLAGRRFADDVNLVPVEPFYRVRFDDGDTFDYTNDLDKIRAQIKRIAPRDLAGYERLMQESDMAFRLGFEKLGSIAYNKLGDLLYAVPSLVKLRGWRSLHGLVANCMESPKLRSVFTLQSLLIGGNPFSVTSVYSLIHEVERRWGVHWAIGGTGAIVQAMVKLLRSRGVEIRCNAEVKEILVERRNGQATAVGVRLAASDNTSGQTLKASIVVSNADTTWTYRYLIAPEHRRHWTDRKIERQKMSMSLFVWYFGLNRRYDDVPHHTMVLGPRYERHLEDIFKRHVLADDFSLYLHRPTATDDSVAPPGCDAFYALVPVPHLGSGTDWITAAESYRQRVAKRLNDTVLPGFEQHVVSSRITTPRDFQDRLLSYRGAAFGAEPILLQSAYFRAHNQSEDIAQLYMVGAGTHPGAGVPGVLMSARALDTVIPDPQLSSTEARLCSPPRDGLSSETPLK